MKTKFLVRTAMVAAIYTVLTLALYFLSYQAIQFRVSELMVLLAFIDPLYLPGLVIGCFIANLLGPYGLTDAIFGSLATLFAVSMIIQTRKWIGSSTKGLFIASLWPAVSGIIIAFGIKVISGAPESFLFWVVMVAIGELAVVTVIGVPLYKWILKNVALVEKLKIKN